MNEIQPMDWSATAAWIALAISITGTILGPIITTILTNRHQIKLRNLDLKEKHQSQYLSDRAAAIENFLSHVSLCVLHTTSETVHDCSHHFFQVYAYVSESLWDSLDELYGYMLSKEWSQARTKFREVSRPLVETLKEEPPELP